VSVELKDSQEFKIEELVIVTKSGDGIDISNIYEEINLYDSIFMPVISGKILIRDSIGLSSRLIFDGSESLLIHITKSPKFPFATYKKAFRIYKQTDRREEGLNSEYYVLNFVSDELLYSDQLKVNQSYTGTYSDIADKIMRDYLKVPKSKLDGIYEPSVGVKKVVIPNLTPLQALEWCAKRALDQKNSPNFLFFESVMGFNFCRLSTLLNLPDVLDIKIELKNRTDSNPLEEMSTARSFEILSQNDEVENIRSGVNAGKYVTFDPVTRMRGVKNISYGDHWNPMEPHGNKYPYLSIIENRANKKNIEEFDSKKFLYMFESSRKLSDYIKRKDPESLNFLEYYEDILFQRKALLKNLTKRRLKLAMPGNFQLGAGVNVYLNIPKFALKEGEDQDKGMDKHLSGKHIIIGSRHIIGYEKHETLIEVSTTSLIHEVLSSHPNQTSSILNYTGYLGY
jgi:hypothetical protein